MKRILLKYMTEFTSLSEEQQQAISESVLIEDYHKGTYLLRQGEVPTTKCYFVLQGCVRQYSVDESGKISTRKNKQFRVSIIINKIWHLSTL